MTTFDPIPNEHVSSVDAPTYREPFGALAAYIQRAGSGERAALARLQPEALLPHQLAALARALLAEACRPSNGTLTHGRVGP